MLGIIRNFIRKLTPNLSADSLRNTPETNPSFTLKGRPNTDPMNSPIGIETMPINRLGFMKGEGRVPDDFNTMGSIEIESMFYENK